DNDDYDYEKSIIPLNAIDSQIPPSNAITPVLPTINPKDSLSIGDEHLIPEKESDKVIKSSVENLVLIPSESKDLTDYESECDMPICDDSSSKNEALDDINDDSSPYSLKELNSEIPDAIIESFSPSPILVEDSDSLMEEIDIFLALDDSIPLGIENDDYDSEGDPDMGVLTTKVVDDISTREFYVHVPNVLPTLYLEFETLLPFSSENEDKVFNPGILISKEEKSPHFLSHRGFKVFPLINDSESPMMIYRGDIPTLDVPYLHLYPL
ncbi:hypothetical protein Tco_1259860, partial [Tanacetum coccineum]